MDADAEARLHYRASRFLNEGAALLDGWELGAWFDRLTEDVVYRVPVRQTRERGADSPFSAEAFHYDDDHGSLATRVERLEKPQSWSNNPPPRTRRFVSNVRVGERDGEEVAVRSNLLLRRSQGDSPEAEILTAERADRLREVGSGLALARRTVYLDETVLGTKDLAPFL